MKGRARDLGRWDWTLQDKDEPWDVTIHCNAAHHQHTKDGRTSWRLAVFGRGDEVEIAEVVVDLEELDLVHCGGFLNFDPADGLWHRLPDSAVHRSVQKLAGAPVLVADKVRQLRLSHRTMSGVVQILRSQFDTPTFLAELPRGAAFQNGFLDLDIELRPFDRSHRVLDDSVLEFNYDPDAKSPEFERYLAQVFAGDVDADDKIRFLQEYTGLCLLGMATDYQRHPMLYGPRASNGKSVYADVVASLFPRHQVASLSPAVWKERFALMPLIGARINVVNELPSMSIAETATVKSVLTGELVSVDIKNTAPISFRPRSGHLFCTNMLPITRDRTQGFFRRFVVTGFNRRFVDDPSPDEALADRHLTEKLRTEREGIAAWAIRGAARVLETGRYTIPASHHELVKEWRLSVDAVAAFADEFLERDPTSTIRSSELYGRLREWAKEQGLPTFRDSQIHGDLHRIGFVKKRTSRGQVWEARWKASGGRSTAFTPTSWIRKPR